MTLADGAVGLRPIRLRDASSWRRLRLIDHEWLAPWEATTPADYPGGPADRASGAARQGRRLPVARQSPTSYTAAVRQLRRDARTGLAFPFALTYEGRFVGQVTVGAIARGSAESAYLGYWITQELAGRGIVPTAIALAVDHAFFTANLHRVEANIRPENAASRRVVEKLGFREEGLRVRYLHIAGHWRDHLCYALTVEDVPGGLLNRWHAVSGRT